jgi:serine/threonine protein kinase
VKKPVPFGKYFLLERINVGGMAEVFRAKSFGVEGFERLVAVKRILPNIAEDRDFIKMFIDEAKIAVQLNHANIAQIFDLGVVDNAYYIALEHIHGRDLRAIFDRCRQAGEPMSIAQACFVVMKVCEGLDYAHNKRDQNNREIGLVHRDVSPQNVLVSFEGEVKLIDFGIAKAADKSAKTQAGILKGKFGYMSPEQVRGLPIDRRSDIFSCGIVLYELLTGERLFVGESDFSTLEKVRNVEILPPSTYNRKIPDELERIVLKALAKDTDDRYQNAIDLHDELQAFVYTASEFYSRKDLAAWMKRTFAKEIDEETAKLESYRQLKPPPELHRPSADASGGGGRTPAPQMRAPSGASTPPPVMRRPTAAMAVVPPPAPGQGGMPVAKPPPPPMTASGQHAAVSPRSTLSMPAVPPPSAGGMVARPGVATRDDSGLSWDDDELETQIYDNPEEEAAARARKAASRGNGMPAGAVAMEAAPPAVPSGRDEPDLSSLVTTAKGWEAPTVPLKSGPSAPTLLGGNGAGNGMPAPSAIASGSNNTPSPYLPGTSPPPGGPGPFAFGATVPAQSRESSAVMRLVEASEPIFDAMSSFGAGVAAPGKGTRKGLSTGTLIGLIAAVLFVGGVIGVWVMMNRGDDKKTGGESGDVGDVAAGPGTAAQPGPGSAAAKEPGPNPGTGPGTATAPSGGTAGFELYVTPSNVAAWRLDGETKTTDLPARIAGLSAGRHKVEIDAPPGFMSESRDVDLAAGEMQRVEIKLAAIEITGVFESTPPGAKVILNVGGQQIAVGETPTRYKLDPSQRYEVVFEKKGYVSVSRPIQISGQPEEKVTALLEPARAVAKKDPPGGGTRIKKDPPPGGGGDVKKDPPPGGGGDEKKEPPPKGEGILSLGAKPPCDIYIDGKSTGLKTPQRELKLSAGRHKVTLMNNEFGIKESFSVEIKTGEVTKQVKDFSDRMAAPQ